MAISCPGSDHIPIILRHDSPHGGPSPFRFEIKDGFHAKVSNWWKELHFEGLASFVLAQKLKAIKELIKRWNKKEIGRLENLKFSCRSKIAEIEMKEQ